MHSGSDDLHALRPPSWHTCAACFKRPCTLLLQVPADPLVYYAAADSTNVPLGPLPGCLASPQVSPTLPPPSSLPPPSPPVPSSPLPSPPSQVGSSTDAQLLLDFRRSFSNGDVVLEDWVGDDPCGKGWIGVTCNERGTVTDM